MITLHTIMESVRICPHIGEFDRLKNDGHPANRVITCREDVREDEIPNFPEDKTMLAVFVPGICVYLFDDGSWSAVPDGDN